MLWERRKQLVEWVLTSVFKYQSDVVGRSDINFELNSMNKLELLAEAALAAFHIWDMHE